MPKNKSKNKPPNPQPKTEVAESAVTENPVEIKSEVPKVDDRVPEPVSEVLAPIESKITESDFPKKPKRNRGQKKNNEKEVDSDVFEEEKAQVPVAKDKEDPVNTQDNKNIQDTATAQTEPSHEITPTARKKKNKNKNKQHEQTEKQCQESQGEIQISSVKKGEELTDLKIITVVPVESEESKTKKKNKKKKRTDSERSDRADEVLACTAAFQKLLENKDDKRDRKEAKQPENQPLESISAKQIPSVAEIKPTEVPDKDHHLTSDQKEESGKKKKKNKKDKKHPSNAEAVEELLSAETKPSVSEITSLSPQIASTKSEEVQKENQPKQRTEIVDFSKAIDEPIVEKEKSPKPKAKIAKPVEKKQKGKNYGSSTEDLVEKQTGIPKTEEKPTDIQHQHADKKEVVKSQDTIAPVTIQDNVKDSECTKEKIVNLIDTKPMKADPLTKDSEIFQTHPPEEKGTTMEEITSTKQEAGFITVPHGGKNKKRKKSPKPQSEGAIESSDVQSEVLKTESGMPHPIDIIQPNLIQSAAEPKKMETEVKPVSEPEKKTSTETEAHLKVEIATPIPVSRTMILETPEPSTMTEILKERTPEKQPEKDNIQAPDACSSKKRKKSPKPQRKQEPKPGVEKSPQQQDTENMSQSSNEIPREQREKTSTSMPSLEDIEIRSIKTDESDGSTCDVVPDVQYPRASSQNDGNNNTVIQEVITAEGKLEIPASLLNIPLVQDSGETPISTPLVTASPSVSITEINTSKSDKPTLLQCIEKERSPKPEEKTDIKSKMIDVNVGMEELRKSIERSLAELSAIEKSEKDAEENFAKAQAKLEAISDMAMKKSQEKKTVPIELVQLPKDRNTDKEEKPKEKSAMPCTQAELSKPQTAQKPKEKSPAPCKQTTELKKAETMQLSKEKSPVPKTTVVEKPEYRQESPIASANVQQKHINKPKHDIINPQPEPISKHTDIKTEDLKPTESSIISEETTEQAPPVCPARNNNKGKGKKRKGKQEVENSATTASSSSSSQTTGATITETTQESKKEEKSEQKTESTQTQGKGKQQSTTMDKENVNETQNTMLADSIQMDFESIENFEDALVSNIENSEDDVNKCFEMIANDAVTRDQSQNPEINVTAPTDDEDKADKKGTEEGAKVNPVSQPKNLLGQPNIPARLNKTDYKKEKNKTPNTRQAKVKIKDAVPIEVTKESKESQTESKRRFLKDKTVTETVSSVINDNEEYIYKYSFRKVFLPSACHVCKKDLKTSRVGCTFCNLIFYCSSKHKDEDYTQHQGFCFAVSTIIHLKDQKHIYADAKNIKGHEYRLLRMQMIVSCEKVLKRRLTPWEQEALLYPRICADPGCREWRQSHLVDCEGCGQIAYCKDNATHLPQNHQRWCKSYSLYHKLVVHQQTRGRLEPRLPSRVLDDVMNIPEKLNEVLASMYDEKIDMTDIQYAALTQIATAPLTAAYCQQLYTNKMNAVYANGVNKKSSFTIHVVGAELQFEADVLNKWEVFFLHLRPDIKDLRIVLVGPDLNPSKLPLDLLGKIRMCDNCRQNNRRVLFDFQDNKTYNEYWSTDFSTPDLVCAFNPSIHRSSIFNGKDTWPNTIKCILKLKVPFVITSYTMTELQRDLLRIKECSEVDVTNISEAKYNAFASVRPDRNFISDDEMPLLFKNFCFAVICGSY